MPSEITDFDEYRRFLKTEVDRVFHDWERSNSVQAELDNPDEEELETLYSKLSSAKWNSEICLQSISKFGLFSIPLMSDRVFTYFLPSLMLVVLSDTNFDSEIIDCLQDGIANLPPKNQKPRLKIEIQQLDDSQRELLVKFLTFLKEFTYEEDPKHQRRLDDIITVILNS